MRLWLQAMAVAAMTAISSCAAAPPPPVAAEEPKPTASPTKPVDRAPVPDVSGFLRRPARDLNVNDSAIALIKDFEGLRLAAYQGQVHLLIGYGHASGVVPGMRITRQEAEEMLRADLAHCENTIEKSVTVLLTENEFSALAALCFNIGEGGFRRSLTVRLLNDGDRLGAANAMLHWRKANGKVLANLAERRAKERDLFLAGGMLTVANPPTLVAYLRSE